MSLEITSANAAQAIMKVVANQALPALFGNLVMGNLVNRDFEPALANSGDTVNVPIPPVLVANNIAEAGSVTNQNPSLGNAQIVLSTHAEATFTIPDVTRAIVNIDLLQTYMNPAIIAIAESIETSLMSLYPQFTSNAAIGSATAMTEAFVDTAETELFAAKVPAALQRNLIVCANAASALRTLSRFSEYQIGGPPFAGVIQTAGLPGGIPSAGLFGKIKDFMVYRTQFVQNVSTTFYNLAFARDAMGLVIRRLPMPLPGTGAIAQYVEFGNFGLRIIMSYQPTILAQAFTVDVLYGVGVLRNSFGVQVKSS